MNADRFDTVIDEKEVSLFNIFNNHISCYITNYGARVVNLVVHDNLSAPVDVVLGFDSIEGYLEASEKYHGATVGRYANRIANGRFSISGTEYNLQLNNPPNSLHGGVSAMHNQVWSVINHESDSITLQHLSPHMAEGFPGELVTKVKYELKGSDLVISYQAVSTDDTIINLTHHSYFNLNGEGSGTAMNHDLLLNSEYYTPINKDTIPTGKLDLVSGTPFDFTTPKRLGLDIDQQDQQLEFGYGYDHNFIVNNYEKDTLGFVGRIVGDVSNIILEVWSTEPGVQLYTANHLDGTDMGKRGVKYAKRSAFCLETQHFPDSPNQPQFPSTLLSAGATYESTTEYRFGVK